jgi:hypothetical protein
MARLGIEALELPQVGGKGYSLKSVYRHEPFPDSNASSVGDRQ